MSPEENDLTTEINELLATLTQEEKSNDSVAHALEVREALAARNYHRLFRLYNSAPNMGGYLMDFFVERERVAACCIICKSYRPINPWLTQLPPRYRYPIYHGWTWIWIRFWMRRIFGEAKRRNSSDRGESTNKNQGIIRRIWSGSKKVVQGRGYKGTALGAFTTYVRWKIRGVGIAGIPQR